MSDNLLDNGDFSEFSVKDQFLGWANNGKSKYKSSKEKCQGKNVLETTERPNPYSGPATDIHYKVSLGWYSCFILLYFCMFENVLIVYLIEVLILVHCSVFQFCVAGKRYRFSAKCKMCKEVKGAHRIKVTVKCTLSNKEQLTYIRIVEG